MDDLISRKAAIDAVEYITSSMSVCVNSDECHGMKRMQRQAVIELTNLPSAQPEIIRCKDCDWWTKQEGSAQGRCELMQMYPTGGWYCGNARRRTDG